MSESIFGRSTELASIDRFLEASLFGPSVLTLEGEMGAGKTALWSATVSGARARGYRVLTCHPAESERSLPYAALGDLLEGVLRESDLELPEPQDRALKVALLMEDPGGTPADQRSVSVATLSVLRSISERSAVVIAIDDLQWMDRASARVLDFVSRRLGSERLGVVAAFRSEEPDAIPSLLVPGLSGREPCRLKLAPLGRDALDALFRARLESSFVRPMLSQIAAASGGNPLFALELARGILRGEVQHKSVEPLSMPQTLQQLARARLAGLPNDVRSMLFVAAAVSDPTIELLERAAAPKADVPAGMEIAVSAGTVEMNGNRIRFTHPLFASTLYHAVRPKQRRALHRRLARLVADPVERARHLALAANGPDRAVAAALEAAARTAALRGASDSAAELVEQAVRLTPGGDPVARDRRRADAAEYHFAAGDLAAARRILEEMVTGLAPGPIRASILRRLAKVRYRTDSCSVAADLLTRALRESADDAWLRAGIERDLAWAIAQCGDMRDAAEHARSALTLVESGPEDEMLAELLAATGMADFLLGRGMPIDVMRRSVELERSRLETPIEWRPTMMLGMMLKWSGDLHSASRVFDDLHHRIAELGDETSLPFVLWQLSETATLNGDWTLALRRATEAHTIALQTGQEVIRSGVLYARASAQAHLGLVEDARASARAGLELAEQVGSVMAMMLNQSVLGFVELSLDEPAAAHSYMAPLVAWIDVVGIREPGVLRFLPDEMEALVALGELDQADTLLTEYEADVFRLGRAWSVLAAARCRALHTAAAGDAGSAADHLERSLSENAALVPPFEKARGLLVLGAIERRTRRRKAAQASLQHALEIFDQLGARSWSARARRTAGLGAREATDPARQLTPAERRVARLVAAGATNREAADRLFVSVRAVEVHLTSIYRKLGIRSRTELAVTMTRSEPAFRDRQPAAPASRFQLLVDS